METKSGNIPKLLEDTLINTEKELKKLSDKKNKLYEFLENEIYTLEVFLERSKILDAEINSKKKAIKEIKKELNAPKKNIVPLMENIIVKYNSLTINEKNKLLKAIIKKVVYFKNSELRLDVELKTM